MVQVGPHSSLPVIEGAPWWLFRAAVREHVSHTVPLTDIKCTRVQICQMPAECHGNGRIDTVYNRRGVAEMHSQLLEFFLVSCRRRDLMYALSRNGELSSSVEGECFVR